MITACVGFHGSEFDYLVLNDAFSIEPRILDQKLDPIDLRNGRDFLTEDFKYDCVILNYIFLGPNDSYSNDPSLRISDLHKPEEWQRRLISTGASLILVFGFCGHGEVTGDYIGELSGYTLTVIRGDHGSIWKYTLNKYTLKK